MNLGDGIVEKQSGVFIELRQQVVRQRLMQKVAWSNPAADPTSHVKSSLVAGPLNLLVFKQGLRIPREALPDQERAQERRRRRERSKRASPTW
jgi:hypothetical protein